MSHSSILNDSAFNSDMAGYFGFSLLSTSASIYRGVFLNLANKVILIENNRWGKYEYYRGYKQFRPKGG